MAASSPTPSTGSSPTVMPGSARVPAGSCVLPRQHAPPIDRVSSARTPEQSYQAGTSTIVLQLSAKAVPAAKARAEPDKPKKTTKRRRGFLCCGRLPKEDAADPQESIVHVQDISAENSLNVDDNRRSNELPEFNRAPTLSHRIEKLEDSLLDQYANSLTAVNYSHHHKNVEERIRHLERAVIQLQGKNAEATESHHFLNERLAISERNMGSGEKRYASKLQELENRQSECARELGELHAKLLSESRRLEDIIQEQPVHHRHRHDKHSQGGVLDTLKVSFNQSAPECSAQEPYCRRGISRTPSRFDTSQAGADSQATTSWQSSRFTRTARCSGEAFDSSFTECRLFG